MKTRKDNGIDEGNWMKIGTPRMVLFLRGREDVTSLSHTLDIL